MEGERGPQAHKGLIVGGRRSCLGGFSEVLNAMQTGLKEIYSDTYRGNLKSHVSSCVPAHIKPAGVEAEAGYSGGC